MIDLYSMKRLAATQLGCEISDVADAAMQREERYSECQCSWRIQEKGHTVADKATTQSNWDHVGIMGKTATQRRRAQVEIMGKTTTQRHRSQVADAITQRNKANVGIMGKTTTLQWQAQSNVAEQTTSSWLEDYWEDRQDRLVPITTQAYKEHRRRGMV